MLVSGRRTRKQLKICCGITSVGITIFAIISVILFFTVFKPKQPQITAHNVSLQSFEFQIIPSFSLNATISLVVTIDNKNYGGFRFKNTTSIINYHGVCIAEASIEHDTVPARGELNLSMNAIVTADKLILSPYFSDDLLAGCFNLTATAKLHGKVSVFKVFKTGATVFSTCDISVYILSQKIETKCNSKVKL